MTYKELLKRLANYDGNCDDEVIFVDFNDDKTSFIFEGNKAYHISSVGFTEADGKCILNNVYD